MNKPKITGPEKRSFRVTVRAESQSDEMSLVGRAASFNTLSSDLGGFREMLAVGCFDRSLAASDDIKCLANHDASRVLGTRDSGTLSLACDSNGLNFRCRLNPAIQFHRDVYEVVKAGLADQCSFAFSIVPPDGDDWNEVEENGQRFVKRVVRNVKLFEVSCAVTFPAYPGDATSTDARTKAANATREQRIAAAAASVAADTRKQRIVDAGAAVARDLSGDDVSGMEDWLADRLAKHFAGLGSGWRLIHHNSKHAFAMPADAFDDDESDCEAMAKCSRFMYGIDDQGNVVLSDQKRLGDYPEDEDPDFNENSAPVLAEMRDAAIWKRRMRASAGIFHG